jgi:phospholipase C
MGGFANCAAVSTGTTGLATTDYIPHHAFFQYWQSTLNTSHTPRTSVAMIGHQGDAANHEYDLTDFWDAVNTHNMPAVSFLKARAIEDGHAGYSDPLDEQIFLVNTINALQKTDGWKETAVIILYDDSDGWYDHVMGPIVNQSNVSDDQLLGAGNCGTAKPIDVAGDIQNGRCGYGPRLPLLVVSPWAKTNYVDHSVTDQSSILRFIKDNWNLGRIGNGSTDAIAGTLDNLFNFNDGPHAQRLFLDPLTGTVVEPN